LDNLRLFLPTKWSALAKSDELKSGIDQLLAKAQTITVGLQLVVAAKYTPAVERVAKLASEHNLEAIRTLGKLPDERAAHELDKLRRSAMIILRSVKPDSGPTQPLEAAMTEAVTALGDQLGPKADSPAGKYALTALEGIVQN